MPHENGNQSQWSSTSKCYKARESVRRENNRAHCAKKSLDRKSAGMFVFWTKIKKKQKTKKKN